MSASLSATTFGLNAVAATRATSSPRTYVASLPVPRTADECDHLLEVTRRRMLSPEARPFFARELARFLGAESTVWSRERRETLREVLAAAGESAIDAVLEAVAQTSRADVSDEAEAVLRDVVSRSPAIMPALCRRFQQATSPAARASSIRALRGMDARPARTLLEALNDADLEVRDAAATALGRHGGLEAKTYLVRRLARERNEIVRESIQTALEELGGD